jgi:hypothetical protein
MVTTLRFLATLGLCLLLAACQMGDGMTAPRSAAVLDGQMLVGLPAGYCIDKASSRETRETAVLFIGRCSDGNKKPPALISIVIGNGGSAGVMTAGGAALAGFFKSPQGRATLSRRGRASDLKILTASGSDNLLLLRIYDKTIGEYWRAITGLRGRLVTISIMGSPANPLAPAEGRKLLDAALRAMQAANRTPA